MLTKQCQVAQNHHGSWYTCLQHEAQCRECTYSPASNTHPPKKQQQNQKTNQQKPATRYLEFLNST